MKIKLELSEGGGIQIGNTAYNKSEEIDCKYGDTFEKVKIIPKPGYIIKSATWNDGELTILQDEDTVGKVSLPSLKEDAALTVSFEQAEVEQEAQFPDDKIHAETDNSPGFYHASHKGNNHAAMPPVPDPFPDSESSASG